MSLRVVLLTRTSRPSGAQMAWRLFQSGTPPVAILVEKRKRMVSGKNRNLPSLIRQFGFSFLWQRFRESVKIQLRYFWRKLLKDRFKNPGYLSIQEWALDHPSVPLIEVDDHNGEQTRELLWRLEPDVGVLTNTRRIRKDILQIPRHGFLNLHLSALPQYAGLDSIFWALYHGETEIGVSVHEAAEEIDRGHLVIQKKIPVCSFDDESSLYEKALWLGTHLMTRALAQIKEGRFEARPQEREGGSYFSWPTPKERASLRSRRQQVAHPPSDEVRVLHLITRMSGGGAQENTLLSALGLARKGYAVTLMTGPSWDKEGEVLSEALETGLEVVMIPELVREISPWKDLVAFFKIFSWLRRNPCTVLHTHTSKAGILGRLAALFLKIPVVIHTPHGHVFHSYFSRPQEKFFLGMERLAAKKCHRLVALTEKCRQEHLELCVGSPDQWKVIPSGVNPARFEEGPAAPEALLHSLEIAGKRIVGYVGRLAPVKGARYLLEAFARIAKRFPEAHCLLVGDGEEKTNLKRQIQELGLERRVTLTGQRSNVAELMSLMEIIVVPSLNEGMGRVIVEAGFAAKPVVGTRVGGIPDLITHEKTGLLVEPRDGEGIAQALTRLFEDPAFSKGLGENLYRKVTDGFTADEMVEKIHQLYQEVLGKPETVVCK